MVAGMPPASALLLATTSADAAGFSADNPAFAVAVCSVLVGVFFTVDKVDAFIQRRRRQPTLDAQLERMASAITALTSSVDELKRDRDSRSGHSSEITLLKQRCEDLQKQADAAREKSDREAAANRKYTMETTREIFELIRKQDKERGDELKQFMASVNTVFRDFSLQIGALTEAVKNGR